MPIRFLVLSFALVWAAVGQAADPKGVVAVLPFDFQNAKMDDGARTALMETVRTVASDAFSPAGYTVLTGENTLSILQDNGVDAAKACDASCALGAARELKASVFLSATVTTTEGTHLAFVRLFESAHGSMLSSVQLEGKSVLDLRAQLTSKSDAFFKKALSALNPPPAPAVSGTEARPTAAGTEARPVAAGKETRPTAAGTEARPTAVSGTEARPTAVSGTEARPAAGGAQGWVPDWKQHYGDAANALASWRHRHGPAATEILEWETTNPLGFGKLVTWAAGHPRGGALLFAKEHPKMPKMDVIARTHALAFDALLEWTRQYPKAATSLAGQKDPLHALEPPTGR